MKRRKLVVTNNFEKNLDVIEVFNAVPSQHLIASFKKLERVVRQLATLPEVGRVVPLTADDTQRRLLVNLVSRLGGGQLRECLAGDLLVLYLAGARSIFLLAVRHHRQRRYEFD